MGINLYIIISAGAPNVCKPIAYGDQLTEWFYVYFGYNKLEKKAFAYIEFTNGHTDIPFEGVNHFYANKYFLYLG